MEDLLKRLIKSIKVNENTISLLLGVVIVFVVGGMIYNYFQDTPAQLPVIEDTKINEILSDINSTESAQIDELAENSISITVTPTQNIVPTNTPVATPTNTPMPTNTPAPTNTPTNMSSPTNTPVLPTSTPLPTLIVNPTSTPVPTQVPTIIPTNTPMPTPTQLQGQIASGVSTEANQGTVAATSTNKHIVVKGENLWKISEKYFNSGYAWVEIAKVNNLSPNQVGVITVGQELNIPQVTKEYAKTVKTDSTIATNQNVVNQITGDSYEVVKGDNLWSIAVRAYGDGLRWNDLYEANKNLISNPRIIDVGLKLKIDR